MPKKIATKNKEKEGKVAPKKLSAEEFEARILAMAGKGMTSEKIGESLRHEGIHPKEHGIKISKILKAKGLWDAPEVKNMEAKLQGIAQHHEKNRQDKRAMREKERIFSELRKIKAYFKVA